MKNYQKLNKIHKLMILYRKKIQRTANFNQLDKMNKIIIEIVNYIIFIIKLL